MYKIDDWGLSRTEKIIYRMLLRGLDVKEISKAKEYSEHTVKTFLHRIYKKKGVSGKYELLAQRIQELESAINGFSKRADRT